MRESSPLSSVENGAKNAYTPREQNDYVEHAKSTSILEHPAYRLVGAVGFAAIIGAAMIYSISARADQQPRLNEENALKTQAITLPTASFSFDSAKMDVTIEESATSKSSERTTDVTVDVVGIPQSVVEYGNSLVGQIVGTQVQSLSYSALITRYMASSPEMMMPPTDLDANVDPPPSRRLDLPLSNAGSLRSRVQSTKSTCSMTQLDVTTSHSRYVCQLPHSFSSEFSDSISSMYQGVFQVFKELYGQSTQLTEASTELSSATWELTIDGTSTSIKLHPYSDDVTMSYWSAIATGPAAEIAIQGIQSSIQSVVELVTPKNQLSSQKSAVGDSCTVLKLSKTKYDLKCYPLGFATTTGVVGGFSAILGEFTNVI